MATKPTIATVAVGQKISASLWNNAVYNGNNFFDNKKPVCLLTAGTTSNLATSTFTSINFDTEVIDTDNQHSTVSNLPRVVIGGTLGWYRCSGAVAFLGSGATNGRRGAQLAMNGTGQNGSQTFSLASTTSTGSFTAYLTPFLVQSTLAADYVELQGWQDTGGNLATQVSGAFRSCFFVEYVGTLA